MIVYPACCFGGCKTCAQTKHATDYPIGNPRRDEWDAAVAAKTDDQILIYVDKLATPVGADWPADGLAFFAALKAELEGHTFTIDEILPPFTSSGFILRTWRFELSTVATVGATPPFASWGDGFFFGTTADMCPGGGGPWYAQATGNVALQVEYTHDENMPGSYATFVAGLYQETETQWADPMDPCPEVPEGQLSWVPLEIILNPTTCENKTNTWDQWHIQYRVETDSPAFWKAETEESDIPSIVVPGAFNTSDFDEPSPLGHTNPLIAPSGKFCSTASWYGGEECPDVGWCSFDSSLNIGYKNALGISMTIDPFAPPPLPSFLLTPCTGDTGATYLYASNDALDGLVIKFDNPGDNPDPQSRCYTCATSTGAVNSLPAYTVQTDCSESACTPYPYLATKCDDPFVTANFWSFEVIVPNEEIRFLANPPAGLNTTDNYIVTDNPSAPYVGGSHVTLPAEYVIEACPAVPTPYDCIETSCGNYFYDPATMGSLATPEVGKWFKFSGGGFGGCCQVISITPTSENNCESGGTPSADWPYDDGPYDDSTCFNCSYAAFFPGPLATINIDANGFSIPTEGQYIMLNGFCEEVGAISACAPENGNAVQESEPFNDPSCT